MMKIRPVIVGLAVLLLCGATPDKTHPLNLVVPDPTSALRLALYKTIPDETVLDKVRNLEHVTRTANPNVSRWAIYLTPTAATIQVKGWKADLNRPDTPIRELTLGECLRWLCRYVPDLRFEVLNDRILIDIKDKEPAHNKASQIIGAEAAHQPER